MNDVRRDGLREAVANWLVDMFGDSEYFALRHADDLISRVLEAVPDVPPAALVIHVEADALDGGFISSVVGVPGCISQGETAREAVANVLDALDEFGADVRPGTASPNKPRVDVRPGVPPDPPAVDVEARISNLPVCGCDAVAYSHQRACPLRQAVTALVHEIQARAGDVR